MNLIPLPTRHIQPQSVLPFRIYDVNGQLMLPVGASLADVQRLHTLRNMTLYVDDQEASTWLAQRQPTVQSLMASDAPIQQIAGARWQSDPGTSVAERNRPLVDRWDSTMRALSMVLRDPTRDAAWVQRLHEAVARCNAIARSHPAQVLFLLIHHAGHSADSYNSHHATLCAVVCARVALLLEWPEDEIQTLVMAAATMNLSMNELQDQLAKQHERPSPDQQQQIESHALRSATQLAGAGIKDPRWLKVVRLHHDASLEAQSLASLDSASRLARLLGRIDRFTAKISRRAGRPAMSPIAAARDACCGADGQPDELGGALLKSLGMYPPGSHVKLASGEVGVVLAPGAQVNQPRVAVLVAASGQALAEPALRDTAQPARAVVGAVPVSQMRVRIQRERLLKLL